MHLIQNALDFSTTFPHNRAMTDFLLGVSVVLGALGVAAGARMIVGMAQDARRMASEALERVEAYGKRGGASAALQDAAQRLAVLERKVAEIDLSVLDTAEKVAARLSDRERKRAVARHAAQDDDDDGDDALWWARARAAHPLPGMPTDGAQLALIPDEAN